MVLAAVGVNSRALWYLTRGTGLVALVLLTVTLVLGITQVVRFARPGLPRFVISALHKNASLVAVAFLAVHIITAVLDTFAPITVVDVFLPFVGTYRPLWLGLGALSFDLMIALIVSSLIRERIGLRTWRALHWTAYACWPVALAHGLGTGTDTKVSWVLFIYVICLGAVLASLAWRLTTEWGVANAKQRIWAGVSSAAVVIALGGWTVAGPLRPGWARSAGTPAKLLVGSRSVAVSPPGSPTTAPTTTAPSPPTSAARGGFAAPFKDTFTGSISQGAPDGSGTVAVTVTASLSGVASGELVVVLQGTPASGGGVSLTQGKVSLGPSGQPRQYQGSVTQLSGREISARVSDGSGQQLRLSILLRQSPRTATVTGTLRATA